MTGTETGAETGTPTGTGTGTPSGTGTATDRQREGRSTGAPEIGLQFSLYPLRQAHLRPAVESAVRAAVREGVTAEVGRLSTAATGDEDSVFRAVRAAFVAARSFGPTVMVVTLSSGLPAAKTVADIQRAAAR